MVETDFGKFETAFRRLSISLGWKATEPEKAERCRIYFKAFSDFDLDVVLQSAKTCSDTLHKFPLIVDWLERLPKRRTGTNAAGALRWMSADEIALHERAVALRFEDAPCFCDACRAAYVDDRPIRFVPNVVDMSTDLVELAWNSKRSQREVVGHWAHGAELGRYYFERDRFYAHARAFAPALVRLIATREPGEEG